MYKKYPIKFEVTALKPAQMPSLLKAEIFASARKPESASINAYIYSMLNFLKSVTFFEKK